SPHLHLEIRPSNDAIRATGGRTFSLAFNRRKNKSNRESRNFKEITLRVESIFPEFFLGKLQNELYNLIDPIYGVKVKLNNIDCILDGGIPHYVNGTIISNLNLGKEKEKQIYLFNEKIGILQEFRSNFGFFKFDSSLKFFLNEVEIRGISLYLAKFEPLVKVIPFQKNQTTLDTNSNSRLTIRSK
ncbi:MAG: hypothetical protein ACFFE4_06065, partial [Candidatus Thorarchaeota archaeon]